MKTPTKKLILDENLAYILGVIEGDGHISKSSIILAVMDKDFALFFKKILEKWTTFKCKYNSQTHWSVPIKKPIHIVILNSVHIVKFLKSFDINKIKKLSNNCKIMFLQGMYDSEGSVSTVDMKEILLYNQDKQLLYLCKKLLLSLNIESNSIRINVKVGDTTILPNGKSYKEIKNLYCFSISKKENLIKFRDLVGFNIKRKQDRLGEMIKLYLTKKQLHFYKSLPFHKRKNWRELWNQS